MGRFQFFKDTEFQFFPAQHPTCGLELEFQLESNFNWKRDDLKSIESI